MAASAKMNVVTTTSDLAALVQEIGGDDVSVKGICRGNQDPHYLEPKPSYTLMLNRADLLIMVGAQIEIGWLPVLLTQSRNPNIQPGSLGHLNASQGLRLLEIPEGPVDRSQGDIHPEGNPHYWLDPHNGLIIAENISRKLSELDPEHAPSYHLRLKDFQKRLQKKIPQWKKAISHLAGKKIVTHHKTFTYLADWTGIIISDVIENKPGIPPSPSHIHALMNEIQRDKISLILVDNQNDPKPAQKLGKETGAKVLVLPSSVGGTEDVKTYLDLLDHLVIQLMEAL